MLIEVKIKITKKVDNKYRKSVETYLLDTEFFSQAEYALTHLLEADMEAHGGPIYDFYITSMKCSSIKEIADQFKGEHSFIATLKDIFVDDDGNEKVLRYQVLLWADDLTEANHNAQQMAKEGYDLLIEGIKQVDYEYYNIQTKEEE